jgi:hypothetical protein
LGVVADVRGGGWLHLWLGALLMPVQRIAISSSQLAELIGIEDPARIRNIVRDEVKREGEARDPHRWWIVVEPEES